jgi:hypothetical protein
LLLEEAPRQAHIKKPGFFSPDFRISTSPSARVETSLFRIRDKAFRKKAKRPMKHRILGDLCHQKTAPMGYKRS